MCKPVILHQNKQGCISWCPGCNHITVAFGTVAFALTPAQFSTFRSLLYRDMCRGCKHASRCSKTLMYQTESRNVQLVLSYTELVQLTSLVNYAALMFDTYSIIYQQK